MEEIFTIGHSKHSIEQFIALLTAYNISVVADVRSSPYSQYSPQFNSEALQQGLCNADIKYVFLGKELGARRAEASCYIEGQAKYDLIKDLPLFRTGLDRVLQGVEQRRVALMCSESDPLVCHRTILVCRELRKLFPELRIKHILEDGCIESQEDIEKRLIKLHKLQPELFGDLNSTSGLVNKAYDIQSERIAYKKALVEA